MGTCTEGPGGWGGQGAGVSHLPRANAVFLQQVERGARMEGTRRPALKPCWRPPQQHSPAFGHPGTQPRGGRRHRLGSLRSLRAASQPRPPAHICFAPVRLRAVKPVEVFRPELYSPLAEVKTCFPVESSPPLAIQFVPVADSYSGPHMISTFILIFHTYSTNKANTNKTFSQMRLPALPPRCDAWP